MLGSFATQPNTTKHDSLHTNTTAIILGLKRENLTSARLLKLLISYKARIKKNYREL